METWPKHIFLNRGSTDKQSPLLKQLTSPLLGCGLTFAMLTSPGLSAEQTMDTPEQAKSEPVQVIQPDITRREIKPVRIDRSNFEIGGYGGIISIEDFDSSEIVGIRGAYHITEDFFFEATYGVAKGDQTSFEQLSGGSPLFSDEDRDYSYYNLALGWNIFPGEVFILDRYAFNSAFYLIAGVGSTEFVGDSWFTATFGAGYRLLLTDWLALHIDVRDHVFDRDSFGVDETTNNVEFHTGLTFFF